MEDILVISNESFFSKLQLLLESEGFSGNIYRTDLATVRNILETRKSKVKGIVMGEIDQPMSWLHKLNIPVIRIKNINDQIPSKMMAETILQLT